MAYKLKNYLRTYRKKAGLSQEEMAYLLGGQSGTKVSRYERFARLPPLKTVLAYAVIFDVPVRDLFAGMAQQVERPIAKRAQQLIQELDSAQPDALTTRKRQTLEALGGLPPANPFNSL